MIDTVYWDCCAGGRLAAISNHHWWIACLFAFNGPDWLD